MRGRNALVLVGNLIGSIMRQYQAEVISPEPSCLRCQEYPTARIDLRKQVMLIVVGIQPAT